MHEERACADSIYGLSRAAQRSSFESDERV